MYSLRIRHILPAAIAISGAVASGNSAVAVVAKVQHHHNAMQLVAEKLKQDGHHDIDHKGKYTTSVKVKNGKIAASHV
jgi:hypothetical protein